MIENCPMRHENGNCIPAGGFCTANKNICEALLNAYRMGKAQLSKGSATSDLISRQQEIDALDTAIEHYDGIAEECRKKANIERNDYMDMRDDAYEARQLAQWLNELKYLREKIEQLTIQPERAIPLSWIENRIKWLKSLDNTFSEITALQISAMVKKWRDEQDETD